MTPLNTLIHPVSITSISLCTIVFTGLSSFQLVPMSTVPDVEGLHHWKCIAARVTPCRSRMAHITILASLGGSPTDCEWPKLWIAFHLGYDPSLQVCCQTRGSESCAFISEELAGWIGRLRILGRLQTPCSPNCARIFGVLYTVEPLCSTSLEAEAICIRRRAPITRNFVCSLRHRVHSAQVLNEQPRGLIFSNLHFYY